MTMKYKKTRNKSGLIIRFFRLPKKLDLKGKDVIVKIIKHIIRVGILGHFIAPQGRVLLPGHRASVTVPGNRKPERNPCHVGQSIAKLLRTDALRQFHRSDIFHLTARGEVQVHYICCLRRSRRAARCRRGCRGADRRCRRL